MIQRSLTQGHQTNTEEYLFLFIKGVLNVHKQFQNKKNQFSLPEVSV